MPDTDFKGVGGGKAACKDIELAEDQDEDGEVDGVKDDKRYGSNLAGSLRSPRPNVRGRACCCREGWVDTGREKSHLAAS